MNLDLDLLPHQAEFIQDTSTRDLALVGGRGCGKTYSLGLKLVTLAALQAGYTGAALSPTGPMGSKVLIPEIHDALALTKVKYDFNKSDRRFDLYFGKKKSILYVLSAENVRDSLGLNLAYFGVDEADTMAPEVAFEAWRKLSAALRAGNPKYHQKVAVSTPEGFGFMHKHWVQDITPENQHGRRLIRGRSWDNPFLPDSFFDDLKATYPPAFLAAYLEGEFVNLTSGSVYPDYDPDLNNTTLVFDELPDNVQTLHVGMDFNVVEPSRHPYGICAVVAVVRNGRPYIIDEVYGASRTTDAIKEIKKRYPGKKIHVYPDASASGSRTSASDSDRTQLAVAGFTDMSPMGNPRIVDRVNAVSAMILNAKGERRLSINKKKCPKLVSCLSQQAYDPQSGAPEKDTGHDDFVDALGYFINVHWPVQKHDVEQQPLRL